MLPDVGEIEECCEMFIKQINVEKLNNVANVEKCWKMFSKIKNVQHFCKKVEKCK